MYLCLCAYRVQEGLREREGASFEVSSDFLRFLVKTYVESAQ